MPENVPVSALAEAAERAIEQITDLPDIGGEVSTFREAGVTFVVEESGTGGVGRPVFVLVHGIGMGRSVFSGLAAQLGRQGRVIAVDQPGYGEAPEPPRTPTMERSADLLAALLRDRGISQAVLVGHSMGTQVVAEVAARHPDLVARLVLIAPTVDAAARHAWVQLWRLGRDLWGESLRVLVVGGREYLRAGPHLRRKMRAMLVHVPEQTYPRVQAETLVLRGADDRVSTRPWCLRVVSLLPQARLAEVPDHGHEAMIKDAAPAARLIRDWLAD